ncbi:unnamed protein product [Linum tenue]|uniref:Isoleucyl-tRNA synthetase n=1 Tax=Linum tenue TaxID=586396 RepID=A0AAV0PT60_9ROSI|nr:unnamed protein product [Linum tenue]
MLRYEPLFNYFQEFSDAAFRVVADNYVTSDRGTGIVHCAPAFGEDDYRVCIENKIINKGENLVVAVDDDGCFTERITDFSGRYVKDADKDIIEAVKGKGRLVKTGSFMHSYPFCWRSDTPLLYRAVPSWFVRVQKLKDQLLENNSQTYWVPDYVKDKRFHNWLENARDWAISRSRFWGTPLPVWISGDGEEIVVIDSVAKLEKLSGAKVFDLHRHKIDHITIPSSRGPEFGVLRRVDDDALRLYLINSPVVRAETLRFKKDGVYNVVKDVFLPWYNAYRFLVQNAQRLEVEGLAPFSPVSPTAQQNSYNVLDQWINSATRSLVHFVRKEMDAYRLYTVVPYLLKFLDDLTNVYVRFNRKRLKGRTGEEDCRIALSTLYNVCFH